MQITELLFALWLPILAVALSQSGSSATTLTTRPSPISPRSVAPALQSIYDVLDILSPGHPHPAPTPTSTSQSGITFIRTFIPGGGTTIVYSFTTASTTVTPPRPPPTTITIRTTLSAVAERGQQLEETGKEAAFAPVNTDLPAV
ncbi:hypothetical protein BKA58DRAFT_174696 [Alternaria rosae]|uniref:uncharacterized protein n=1 Tax=Alternaria rosae TaxID=1187941 RepID=UPI001E8D1373|nr:uncharacterized protein BKA58DRAFT_174696 [Alternaria rosae]KAH6870335.1 hypothetical protein BKA58DRAFT_174696 [Alternaria rosae]